MQRILVATDFSTRSDQAVQRGIMLAQEYSVRLDIVHVIDDDRPEHLVKSERSMAGSLLSELVRRTEGDYGLKPDVHVYLGEPFQGILLAAETLRPDVVVLGPHRRKILQDVFVGTTAERAIRLGSAPFIMANKVPSKPYTRILLATDFSSCATDATRKVQELNLIEGKKTFLLHVYDTPAESLLYRASMTLEESKRYLAQERADAEREIAKFVRLNGLTRVETVLKVLDTTYVDAILQCADEKDADLIVIGSRSQSQLQKLLLSSVAEELLRTSHLDVLAVPSRQQIS